jgi:hypothetical protein
MRTTFNSAHHRTIASWSFATTNEATHEIVTVCGSSARKKGGLKKSQKNLRRGQLT